MLDKQQRRQRASIAALARAATYDGRAVTTKARAAAEARFRTHVLAQAAARGEALTEAEIERRTQATRRLHFARLAFESGKVRRARKQLRAAAKEKTAAGSTSAAVSKEVNAGAAADPRTD